MKKKPSRNLSYIAISIVLILIVLALALPRNNDKSVPLSEVVNMVNNNQVEKVEVNGNKLTVTSKDPNAETLVTYKEDPAVSLT